MAVAVAGDIPSALLVEDEPRIAGFLAENLRADRFAVQAVGSAEAGLAALRERCPDVAVVDVGLPGMSGLDLVAAIRDAGPEDPWDPGLPVLLVSGQADPHARVRGLERGADAYLSKPFHYPELVAMLGALLRRSRGAGVAGTVRVGPLVIDRHAHRAELHGQPLDLSGREFALLVALARDPRRVRTKQELLRDVWGFVSPGRTRTVDSHASRLRRKLARAGGGERWIGNVWGIGYRLLADDD